jgi:hypothetical protein
MDIPRQILKQYGSGFDFGLFAPTIAKVEVATTGFPAFQTSAGVYVGPDAEAWIWLPLDKAHPLLLQSFFTGQVGAISVRGEFDDGRNFSAERCASAHVNSNGAGGFISVKEGKMTANITGPRTVMTNLLVLSPLIIQSPRSEQIIDIRVSYTLINALFIGENETVKFEGSTRNSRRDRFMVKSTKYSWEIAWLEQFDKEQADDLKSGLIQFLPTATMQTQLSSIANPKEFDDEAEAITRLLTLVTGIGTTWVVREIWSGDKLIQQWFERKGLSTNAKGKARYEAISNLSDLSSLRLFLEQTLANFQRVETNLRLNDVIDYLEQARHQKVIQVRIAILVLCLELLSHQWCLQNGCTEDQLNDKNIVSKLAYMRKAFRFIEKRFTDDTLRKDIRNPLIHSGQIPLMDFKELHKWADDLYILALRIILCILGYTGNYSDLTQGMNLVPTPRVNR